MTIIGAITEVLNDNKPRTAQLIYEEIVERKLYTFGAKKPENVVNGKIRRHCEGLDFPSASPVKHFIIAGQDGKHNLYLNRVNFDDFASKTSIIHFNWLSVSRLLFCLRLFLVFGLGARLS